MIVTSHESKYGINIYKNIATSPPELWLSMLLQPEGLFNCI